MAGQFWRCSRLKWTLCLGASLCTFAQSAFGQAAPVSRTDIRVSATDAYEDNALRLGTSQAVPVGFVRNDFRFTPSLDLNIVRPLGQQSLFLSASLGYDFYHRNTLLNRERIKITGGADLRFGNCAQHLQGGVIRQQSDLRDFTRAIRLANAEQRLTAGAALSCGGGLGVKGGLTYDYETVSNDQPLRQISNYNASTFGASVGYVSPVLGELTVFGSYRLGRYPQRRTLAGFGRSDGVDVFNGGVRFGRSIGARLRGTVSLGYSKVIPKLAGTPSFSGASYSADLTWAVNDRLRTKIDVGRSVSQSNLLDVNYSIDDSYAISNSFAVNQSITASFGGSVLKRKFRDSPVLGANPVGRGDRVGQYSGGIDYHPPGRIGFAVDVSRGRRSAAVQQFDYKYLTARLTLRVKI